jgi:hypothetical protein
MYSGWFVFLALIGGPVIIWLAFWVVFAFAKLYKGRRKRSLTAKSSARSSSA